MLDDDNINAKATITIMAIGDGEDANAYVL